MSDFYPRDLSEESLARLLDAALRVGISSAPPESPDWWQDETFPYVTVAYIGRGGSGLVWKASRKDGYGFVALKLVPFLSDPVRLQQRWEDECAALAKIQHANLVGLIDHGRSPDGLSGWLAMEWIEGTCLGRKLAEEGQIAFREILAIVPQAVAGLDALHNAELVHRDIKPSNLLLEKATNRLVIADLGIVHDLAGDPDQRVTRTYEQALTPGYFPPELLAADYHPDALGDQYSLAFTIWQLLTATMPLGAFGKLHHLCKCPDGIDAVLRRALASEPARRYTDLSAFAQAFAQAARRPPRTFLFAVFFTLILVAASAYWTTRPPLFPKRFKSGKVVASDSTQQFTSIDLTLQENGHFSAQIRTTSLDPLFGFVGRTMMTFRDAEGYIVHQMNTNHHGVGGRYMFGAPHDRVDQWNSSIPAEIASQVVTMDFKNMPSTWTLKERAADNNRAFREDLASIREGVVNVWTTLNETFSLKPKAPAKEATAPDDDSTRAP